MGIPEATTNPNAKTAQSDGVPRIYRRFVRGFQGRFRAGTLHYVLPNGATGTIHGAEEGPGRHHRSPPLACCASLGLPGQPWLRRSLSRRRLGEPGPRDVHRGGCAQRCESAGGGRSGNGSSIAFDTVAAGNTKNGSRRNIAAHYDLGNDFYAKWLDPSMTYSSAVYPEDAELLEDAQSTKYGRLLDLVSAKPG